MTDGGTFGLSLERFLVELGRVDVPSALAAEVTERVLKEAQPAVGVPRWRIMVSLAAGSLALILIINLLPALLPSSGPTATHGGTAIKVATPSPQLSIIPTSKEPSSEEFNFVTWRADGVPIVSELGGDTMVALTIEGQLAVKLGSAELDGIEWIRVQVGRGYAQDHLVNGWVPRRANLPRDGQTFSVDPVYEPASPRCPRAPTVTDLDAMPPAQALGCYGSQALTFSPVRVRRETADERAFVTGEPDWLAISSDLVMYDSDGPDLTGSIRIHMDPADDIVVPTDEWLEIRGGFDDPGAAECTRSSETVEFAIANQDEAVLWCRERFVVSAFRILPEGDWPTPRPLVTPGPPATRTINVSSHETRAPITPRFNASGVWTGSEAIVWGGSESLGDKYKSDGAVYDPERDQWRKIADGPLTPRAQPLVAWTGSEMLIWGGNTSRTTTHADGAAYDPSADRWRPIADGPLTWEPNASAIWTGTEWEIATVNKQNELETAAYDPMADNWRTLPSLSAPYESATDLTWTGAELILLNSTSGMYRLRPEAAAWVAVAAAPDGLPVVGKLAWTGDRIIGTVHQYVRPGVIPWEFLAGWSPASDSWEVLPQPPANLIDSRLVWADQRAILLGSELAYEPASQAWWNLPAASSFGGTGAVIVWLGDRLMIWGGGGSGPGNEPTSGGIVIKPDW